MTPRAPLPIHATHGEPRSRPGSAKLTKFLHMKHQDRAKEEKQVGGSEKGDSTRPLWQSSRKSNGAPGGAESVPVANDLQATAIPDPIPVGSQQTDSTIRTTLTISPTFSFVAPTNLGNIGRTSSQSSEATELSTNGRSTTTIWIPASGSMVPHAVIPTPSEPSPASSNTSFHLPVFAIVLFGVGAAGLVLVALLVLRCFLRRHGRVHFPRPSAPILQDSPLFGGKERFSRGLWSDPSFSNLLSSHAKPGKGDGWRPLSGGIESISEKTRNKRQSTFLTTNLAVNNSAPAPVSPASVYTMMVPATAVGVALEFPVPPQTVKVATQPLKIKDKGTERKGARRRSRTTSVYGGTDISTPTLTETEASGAYQAPRPAPTPKAGVSSRDHVQRPSRKNVPPLASQGSHNRNPSVSRAARGRDKEEPFMYALPTVKSQERRDRDTKALTSALGLPSPPPPSSCFSPVSIYPDDSLSVAHGRNYTRPFSEAPLSEMPSPTGTVAALGDFMLQEFPSTATFNSLRAGDPFAGDASGKNSGRGRVNDRPPRVPSPPPLPSLAQMAMADADPDYRSPTYSIYGLYEAQRKSKRSSGIT